MPMVREDAGDDQAEHHRGEQQAGIRDTGAQHALEFERDEDDHPEHPEGSEEADHHRNRERAVFEQCERHDRFFHPLLDDEERDQHGQAEAEQAQDRERGPSLVLGYGEGDQHRDQTGGERGRPDEVDVAPRGFGSHEGQEGGNDDHAEQTSKPTGRFT